MLSSPKLRKTKIVATIGPACDSSKTLTAMVKAGMNVARLNLSYGTLEEHKKRIEKIRKIADQQNVNIAIMVDTRGIEIRTGKLIGDFVDLASGNEFLLYTGNRSGDASGVGVSYTELPSEVFPGTPILLDDGAIELLVQSVQNGTINCRIVLGGRLGENKSVNLPDTELSISMIDPENRVEVEKELSFAVENDVEYIAASFVQNAEDIHRMKEVLEERNTNIPIIAKIENKAGVANLESIVGAADGVMVARGDLGVELPLAEVPSTQKKIIRMTVSNGKPVITATEMLASMIRNPKPTRAEASDVANAILDGSSAVMLSGETAAGKYPVQAIMMMSNLAIRAEASLSEFGYLQKILPSPTNVVTEAVSQAAISIAEHLNAAAIFSLTSTGLTSRLISKYRTDRLILAVVTSKNVARRLAMNWGVIPLFHEGENVDQAKIKFGISRAKELGYISKGDIIVVTSGYMQRAGGTDLIRVITLEK